MIPPMLAIVDAVRAAARRQPRAVDAGIAGVLALAAVPGAAPTGVVAWACLVAVNLPLVWLRRAPATVYWAVLALAMLTWAVARIQSGYPLAPLAVAGYAIARYRDWWHLLPAGTAILALLTASWLRGALAGSDLAALVAVGTATGALGVYARTRQAYVAMLRERAERLERERDQQARLAAAAERTRIAREMHDVVAHHLAVMTALADGAALTAVADPRRGADTLVTIATTGRQALDQTQRLVGVLRDGAPADRAPQPGFDELPALVDQVRHAGLPVTLTVTGTPDPATGRAVYRIVQEALTNTLKHADPAATATVRLRHTATGTELDITDDGPRRRAQGPAGHGLAGMAERVAAYGGTIEAGPLPESGWRVSVRLPAGAPA